MSTEAWNRVAQSELEAEETGLSAATAYWDRAILRAGRPERLFVRLEKPLGAEAPGVRVTIELPEGLATSAPASQGVDGWRPTRIIYPGVNRVDEPAFAEVSWPVAAAAPMEGEAHIAVDTAGGEKVTLTLPARVHEAVEREVRYVPEPEPAQSDLLVGAIVFPGWQPGSHWGWSVVEPFPERKPVLGWYDGTDPEIVDWEVKYALEHGIDFFMYCWYRERESVGGPVTHQMGEALHEGLFQSRYGDRIKFAIMWENYSGGAIADLADMKNNLWPYWLDNYFSRDNYLVVDNKPVLYIYAIYKLAEQMGGSEPVREVIDWMRGAAKEAGFEGLWVLSESRGSDPATVELYRDCGLDSWFVYCFHHATPGAPDEQQVNEMMDTFAMFEDWDILPLSYTVTVGWKPEPWERYVSYNKSPHWYLDPAGYQLMAERVREQVNKQPPDHISSKVVLLDNWNEFGEGHYILPHREWGFAYLDAVRNAFTDAPRKHQDLIPQDVGLGADYSQPYRQWIEERTPEEERQ